VLKLSKKTVFQPDAPSNAQLTASDHWRHYYYSVWRLYVI